MKLSKTWTTVTPLSKTLALILVIALPFIGFYVGTQYRSINNLAPIVNVINGPDKLVISGSARKTVTGPKVQTLYSLIQNAKIVPSDATIHCPAMAGSSPKSYALTFYEGSNKVLLAEWSTGCGGWFIRVNSSQTRQIDEVFKNSLTEVLGILPDQLTDSH